MKFWYCYIHWLLRHLAWQQDGTSVGPYHRAHCLNGPWGREWEVWFGESRIWLPVDPRLCDVWPIMNIAATAWQ